MLLEKVRLTYNSWPEHITNIDYVTICIYIDIKRWKVVLNICGVAPFLQRLLFVCWLSDVLPCSALCCCLCVGCAGTYSYVRIFFTLFLLRISLYSLNLQSVSQNLTKQTVSVICCLDVHIHMNSLNQTLSVKN